MSRSVPLSGLLKAEGRAPGTRYHIVPLGVRCWISFCCVNRTLFYTDVVPRDAVEKHSLVNTICGTVWILVIWVFLVVKKRYSRKYCHTSQTRLMAQTHQETYLLLVENENRCSWRWRCRGSVRLLILSCAWRPEASDCVFWALQFVRLL